MPLPRNPPVETRRKLRQEVGFGCPVQDCGNPYLFWHHFDPPWNVEEHHNLEGMIALCAEHHSKADAGAFTREQLKALKSNTNNAAVQGKFDWMRNSILVVSGGNFSLDPKKVIKLKGQDLIWFTRDDLGNFLLNIDMIDLSGNQRFSLEENFWNIIESPKDVDSPPKGTSLEVRFENDDYIKIEFSIVSSSEQFEKEYGTLPSPEFPLKFPITVVEVAYKDKSASVTFDSKSLRTTNKTYSRNWIHSVGCPFSI